jgi:hypothetical protein
MPYSILTDETLIGLLLRAVEKRKKKGVNP